jgi:ubiquinone/menaquinone biosynthesis C-methylase UbiE
MYMSNPITNDLVRAAWDAIAAFWDNHMGDAGNDFHRELVAPAAEELLALTPGERVLEIACGAGLFARRMAEIGAIVTATDFSANMLEAAKGRCRNYPDQVTFQQLDAASAEQLAALPEAGYDAAVCNMAIMDMIEIEPLFHGVARALRPGGRFVFTLCHPAFNTSGCMRMVELVDSEDTFEYRYSVKVSRYKGLQPTRGLGIVGQPELQYYFDRSIGELFNTAFRAGLLCDGMLEPAFERESTRPGSVHMENFKELPMVLAARMRRP